MQWAGVCVGGCLPGGGMCPGGVYPRCVHWQTPPYTDASLVDTPLDTLPGQNSPPLHVGRHPPPLADTPPRRPLKSNAFLLNYKLIFDTISSLQNKEQFYAITYDSSSIKESQDVTNMT